MNISHLHEIIFNQIEVQTVLFVFDHMTVRVFEPEDGKYLISVLFFAPWLPNSVHKDKKCLLSWVVSNYHRHLLHVPEFTDIFCCSMWMWIVLPILSFVHQWNRNFTWPLLCKSTQIQIPLSPSPKSGILVNVRIYIYFFKQARIGKFCCLVVCSNTEIMWV